MGNEPPGREVTPVPGLGDMSDQASLERAAATANPRTVASPA